MTRSGRNPTRSDEEIWQVHSLWNKKLQLWWIGPVYPVWLNMANHRWFCLHWLVQVAQFLSFVSLKNWVKYDHPSWFCCMVQRYQEHHHGQSKIIAAIVFFWLGYDILLAIPLGEQLGLWISFARWRDTFQWSTQPNMLRNRESVNWRMAPL